MLHARRFTYWVRIYLFLLKATIQKQTNKCLYYVCIICYKKFSFIKWIKICTNYLRKVAILAVIRLGQEPSCNKWNIGDYTKAELDFCCSINGYLLDKLLQQVSQKFQMFHWSGFYSFVSRTDCWLYSSSLLQLVKWTTQLPQNTIIKIFFNAFIA